MTTPQKNIRRNVYLAFPPASTQEPILCNLSRKFDLTFNVFRAQISPRKEGALTLELSGAPENFEQAMEYLKSRNILVSPVTQRITRDEERCIQCGVCTAVCSAEALTMAPDRTVAFNADRCSGCTLCTRICPANAMHLTDDEGAW